MASASPTKPHVNLALLGGAGHGKSTLARALFLRWRHLQPASIVRPTRSFPNPDWTEFESAGRQYGLWDAQPGTEVPPALIAGVAPPEALLLVVAADEGWRAELDEPLRIARLLGAEGVVAFLNKVDLAADTAWLDLVEWDVRAGLARQGFPADEVPVIRGSAQAVVDSQGTDAEACAPIDLLCAALDAHIPLPPALEQQPFLMSIDDVYPFEGTVVSGRIERGRVRVGDEVDLVGLRPAQIVRVAALEMFKRALPEAQAGDVVGVRLAVARGEGARRGQVLAAPGSVRTCTRFEALAYLLPPAQGWSSPALSGCRADVYLGTDRCEAAFAFVDGRPQWVPGTHADVAVELLDGLPHAAHEGQRFAIVDAGRSVGSGAVVSLTPSP